MAAFPYHPPTVQCSHPLSPGCGTVLAVGADVKSLQPGDTVRGTFGFTEYAVHPAAACLAVPTVSAQVTALLISGVLARAMVFDTLEAKRGKGVGPQNGLAI